MSDLRDRSGRGRRAARPEPTASGRRATPATTGVARHGRLTSGGPVRAVTKVVAAAVAVVLVSGVSVGAIALGQIRSDLGTGVALAGEKTEPAIQQGTGIGAYAGGFNILIVGTDNDAKQSTKEFGQRNATLNDVNILLHVSADHTNATAVSIPRDLVVPIPSCAKEDGTGYYSAMSAQPINNAYSYGGLNCVVQTGQAAHRSRRTLRRADLVQRRHRDVQRRSAACRSASTSRSTTPTPTSTSRAGDDDPAGRRGARLPADPPRRRRRLRPRPHLAASRSTSRRCCGP